MCEINYAEEGKKEWIVGRGFAQKIGVEGNCGLFFRSRSRNGPRNPRRERNQKVFCSELIRADSILGTRDVRIELAKF